MPFFLFVLSSFILPTGMSDDMSLIERKLEKWNKQQEFACAGAEKQPISTGVALRRGTAEAITAQAPATDGPNRDTGSFNTRANHALSIA
jgi:hypothetical protein